MLKVRNPDQLLLLMERIQDRDEDERYKNGLMKKFLAALRYAASFGDKESKHGGYDGKSVNEIMPSMDLNDMSLLVQCTRNGENWFTIGLHFTEGPNGDMDWQAIS